jgi:hypothetical protein
MTSPPSRDYRVVSGGDDPDLLWREFEAGHEFAGMRMPNDTWNALEAATRSAGRRKVLAIHCLPLGCGRRKDDGARLCGVWRTDEGLLYVAEVPLGRQQRLEDTNPEAVVMWHPVLNAERSARGMEGTSATWTTRRALDATWRGKGWEEAPQDVRPDPTWRPQTAGRIRDLIDRNDLQHVPLRAHCHQHGAVVLDRELVLAQTAKAARSSARRVPLNAVIR